MQSKKEQAKKRMQLEMYKKKQAQAIQLLEDLEKTYQEHYKKYHHFNQIAVDKKNKIDVTKKKLTASSSDLNRLMLNVYELDSSLAKYSVIAEILDNSKAIYLHIQAKVLLVRLVILNSGISDLHCLANPPTVLDTANLDWYGTIIDGLSSVFSLYEQNRNKLNYSKDSHFQKELGFALLNHITFNKNSWMPKYSSHFMYSVMLCFLENYDLNAMKLELYYRLFVLIHDENQSNNDLAEPLISQPMLMMEQGLACSIVSTYLYLQKNFEAKALSNTVSSQNKIEQIYANYIFYIYKGTYQAYPVSITSAEPAASWNYITKIISFFGQYLVKNLSLLESIPPSEFNDISFCYQDYYLQYNELLNIVLSIIQNIVFFTYKNIQNGSVVDYSLDAKATLLVFADIFKKICINYNVFYNFFGIKDHRITDAITQFQEHINEFNVYYPKDPIILPVISLTVQNNSEKKQKKKKKKKNPTVSAPVVCEHQTPPKEEKMILTKSSKHKKKTAASLPVPVDKLDNVVHEKSIEKKPKRKHPKIEVDTAAEEEVYRLQQLQKHAQLLTRDATATEAMVFFAKEVKAANAIGNLTQYMQSIDSFLPSFGQNIIRNMNRLESILKKSLRKSTLDAVGEQEQLKDLLPQICKDLKNIQEVNNRYRLTMEENKDRVSKEMEDGLALSLYSNDVLITELEEKIYNIQSDYESMLQDKHNERQEFIFNLGRKTLEQKGQINFSEEEALRVGWEEFRALGQLNKISGKGISDKAKTNSFLKGLEPYFNDLSTIGVEFSKMGIRQQQKELIRLKLPETIQTLFSILGKNKDYYLVGSQVVNLMRLHYKHSAIPTADYDFISFNSSKKDLISLGFRQSKHNHNLYICKWHDQRVEVYLTTEKEYKPDFSFAALRIDSQGNLFDLTGHGKKDLKRLLIKTIESSKLRIEQDPVIILRVLKYNLLGFEIDKELKKAILAWEPTLSMNVNHLSAVVAKEIRHFKIAYVKELDRYHLLKKMFGIEKGSILEMHAQLEEKIGLNKDYTTQDRFFKKAEAGKEPKSLRMVVNGCAK